jgi:hypothetical protein
MPVDSAYASWLKGEARWRSMADGSIPSGLQAMSVDSEIISPFASSSTADSELARQVSFLKKALAQDVAIVKGRRSDLCGRCIALKGDQLNYNAAPTVLVIGAAEQDDGTTQLTVLRMLT